MAKIDVTKTELVWPGKYNEDGSLREVPRVNLPFQVIERVNESRATRESKKQPQQLDMLFEAYAGKEGDTFEDGWRNKLIWGENQLVMGSLLANFPNKIDLIYIDPPFATGIDFSIKSMIGDTEIEKEQSLIEEKIYRDTWGQGLSSYLSMMQSRLSLMKSLLSTKGSIFVHCDARVSGYLRAMMDEVFGSKNFRNEITWVYYKASNKSRELPNCHQTIFWYSASETEWKFNADSIRVAYNEKTVSNYKEGLAGSGTFYSGKIKSDEGVLNKGGKVPEDWWEFAIAARFPVDGVKRCGEFGTTEKPWDLMHRIISMASDENDLVADFFCGSGTTLAVAEKLNRRWIGCDLGRWAIHATRKRILGIDGCRPFEILNLGKYERQYWQGMALGGSQPQERLFYEYLAFVLKLYQAQPVSGMSHLHGKKGRGMIHIGAIDSPVTFDEVSLAIEECVKTKQPELHVLGWEWEMGLAGPNNGVKKGSPMHDIAKQKGLKLLLLQIPREVMEQQAVDKGDITFFELAYLNVEINQTKNLHASIALKDFVIPNTELIPEEVREKVKKWSDYIDYWAVDWDFQNDSFMQGWVTYRTRKDRSLALASDVHQYEKSGTYRVLVKVVDIFGNDTSQAYTIEVK